MIVYGPLFGNIYQLVGEAAVALFVGQKVETCLMLVWLVAIMTHRVLALIIYYSIGSCGYEVSLSFERDRIIESAPGKR